MTTSSEMIVGKSKILSSIYEWEIDNYSSYSDLEMGTYILSPSFNVHDQLWNLKLYPNGKNKDAQGNISLYLYLHKDSLDDTTVQVEFMISMISSKNNIIASNKSGHCLSFSKKTGWGRQKFVSKKLVESHLYTTDKIIVVCEVANSKVDAYKTCLVPGPNRIQHFEGLKHLINNHNFSDVKFKVEDKEIFAHKIMLISNSAVFAAMFKHKMQENENNVVIIEDISHKVFSELLRYVYTGECLLSEDILSELFEAADKYQLLKLKDTCEKELCEMISVNNVIELLQLADAHSAENLKKEAIDFIALHGKEISEKSEFETLDNSKLLRDVFRGFFANKNEV